MSAPAGQALAVVSGKGRRAEVDREPGGFLLRERQMFPRRPT